MSVGIYALIILFCIVCSALFSGSETALMRLRPEDLENDIKQQKTPAALAVKSLLGNTSRLLVTILLGNNVVNILAATSASALAVYYLGDKWGLLVSTFATTVIVLIFCEVLPKAIAASSPKRVSYAVALPLYLIHKSLFWVHWIFDRIIDPVVKRISGKSPTQKDNEEELLYLARQFRQKNVEGSPLPIIAGAAGAAEMVVSDIMVPRTEIVAFSEKNGAEALIDGMIDEGHTRIPLYDDSLDHIIGLIHLRDLFKLQRTDSTDLRSIVKPVLRVPERKPILRLLAEMQHTFTHMAIVKDEFGVTQGLVTQEDILEEIVGEIRDEFDQEELETIRHISDDVYEALGRISVLDFNRETGWTIPSERGDTLGGLLFNQLGRGPKQWDKVSVDDYLLSVVGLSGSRITRVRVEKPVTDENAEKEAEA